MRHCLNIALVQLFISCDTHSIIIFNNLCTCFNQLRTDRLKVFWNDIFNQHISAAGSSSDHISSCFYLVGDNGICAAVKLFCTSDFNNIRACTADIRPHRVKEIRKVNNVRLFCGILNNRKSSCKHCCKHNIDCGTNRNIVHINGRTDQLFSLCTDHAVYNVNICTKHFKALDVQINRACAEITAAGHGNLCVFKSAEHCTNQVIACSEMRCKFIWHAFILKPS